MTSSHNETTSNIWVTPRAIAALIRLVAEESAGIIGLTTAEQGGPLLGKLDASQAIQMHKTAQGLTAEIFVLVKRGSNLADVTKRFAERVQKELSTALEQPVAEVLIRIQAVR